MAAVLDYGFELFLDRKPTEEESSHFIDGLFVPCIELGGRRIGLERVLTALMLTPEFLFRMELGFGKELPDGRRMLSPREIAYALSFAVFDYLDPKTMEAAIGGRLESKEDVAREFRRMLSEPDRKVRGPANKRFWTVGKGAGVEEVKLIDAAYPRLLRFFREFFGYTRAPSVFKDDTRTYGGYDPHDLVQDADWFVLRALKDDQQVLKRLLTGDSYFIKHRTKKGIDESYPYNLDLDPPLKPGDKPVKMAEGQRAGMLTHPAWLATYSGNFENDPVRRGKWIQEHLLAGVVPDIPIGVEAQLPEEPHHTLRERFKIVYAEECWRCHTKMNPLGNPFEAYDDFGRYRISHLVGEDGNVIATESEAFSRTRGNLWSSTKGKNAPPEKFKKIPVDTSGVLKGTGDPSLDGPVKDPVELSHKLAKSDHVRQSFIRHVFRFWLGRNETLDDSPTLMAMDKAYLESDGSFRELLVSLVTSDSFLYRKDP